MRHYAIDLEFAEREYSDIDLIGLKRQVVAIGDVFRDLGYVENRHVAMATGNGQLQFFVPRAADGEAGTDGDLPVLLDAPPSDHIDVFLDAMRMDHQVDFRDRLEINTYAIDPADLFLSKLQIVNLNEKDVHDAITLVKDVYVDFQPHPGVLDLHHVAEVCAADWGLYIDVMNNIDTVVEHVGRLRPRTARRGAGAPHARARAGHDDRAGQDAALAPARAHRQARALVRRGRGAVRRAHGGRGARRAHQGRTGRRLSAGLPAGIRRPTGVQQPSAHPLTAHRGAHQCESPHAAVSCSSTTSHQLSRVPTRALRRHATLLGAASMAPVRRARYCVTL